MNTEIIKIIYENKIFSIGKKFIKDKTYIYNSFEFIEDNKLKFPTLENVNKNDFRQYMLFLSLKDFDINNGFLILYS